MHRKDQSNQLGRIKANDIVRDNSRKRKLQRKLPLTNSDENISYSGGERPLVKRNNEKSKDYFLKIKP